MTDIQARNRIAVQSYRMRNIDRIRERDARVRRERRAAAGVLPRVKSASEAIDRYSIPVTESGCLLWTGMINHSGYGRIRIHGVDWLAHRLSWTEANGAIPDGKYVCHKCDVPSCINPSHLFLGTQAENIADMVLKGRQQRGESRARAKLTESDVRAIRLAKGVHGEIAKCYGVDRTVVSGIKRGDRWGHVHG